MEKEESKQETIMEFLKCDVLRLHEYESSKNYAESLKGFMNIWKEEGEMGRKNGEKNLIEWLRLLDQSENQERKTTFKVMRLVVVEHLALTFLLMSFSATTEEIRRTLDDLATILMLVWKRIPLSSIPIYLR
ncbi:hypothetical protein L484_015645 [Morus notabilis]|uniref:Uncharacterized protein n=1 Tax=Morus notabilis TaxID=981085 RepID=W9QYG0_9ROSA|nr:hypothetical protein L484_015645 [Morus notabilis]